jgi:hypothetical protein
MPKIAQTRTATNREMLQRGKEIRKRRIEEQINKEFFYNIDTHQQRIERHMYKNRHTHIEKGIWTAYSKAGSK